MILEAIRFVRHKSLGGLKDSIHKDERFTKQTSNLMWRRAQVTTGAAFSLRTKSLTIIHYDEIHEDLKLWTPADVLRLNRRTSAGVQVSLTRSLTVGMKFLDASSQETC